MMTLNHNNTRRSKPGENAIKVPIWEDCLFSVGALYLSCMLNHLGIVSFIHHMVQHKIIQMCNISQNVLNINLRYCTWILHKIQVKSYFLYLHSSIDVKINN